MNRFVFFVLVFLFPFAVSASSPEGCPRSGADKEWSEQIKSEKVSYITDKLALTPEEATVFWPLYRAWWADMEKAHSATCSHMKKMKEMISSGVKSGSAEWKSVLESYIKSKAAETEVYSRYYEKFSEILSADRVAALYVAEDNFRRMVFRRLRSGGDK